MADSVHFIRLPDRLGQISGLMGTALCGVAPEPGTLWALAKDVTCVACQKRIAPEPPIEWTAAYLWVPFTISFADETNAFNSATAAKTAV